MAALVKENLSMLAVLNRILKHFGATILIDKGPLTDDEWDAIKVMPLYQEWLKNPDADDEDIIDPDLVQQFLRGEISVDELMR
jgi:hypothetical protein